MKKTINISLGGRTFIINEDAFNKLSWYIDAFSSQKSASGISSEVKEDLEMRISELLRQSMTYEGEVVDIQTVNRVIDQIGYPEGNASYRDRDAAEESYIRKGERKFYRDADRKTLGGVCSGLANYFNLDLLLVRLIFLALVFFGGGGFFVYIILWIICPTAKTSFEKCEMRGWAPTPENLDRVNRL